jgi:hypothetical protein
MRRLKIMIVKPKVIKKEDGSIDIKMEVSDEKEPETSTNENFMSLVISIDKEEFLKSKENFESSLIKKFNFIKDTILDQYEIHRDAIKRNTGD